MTRSKARGEFVRLGREGASVLGGNIFAGIAGFGAYTILARILSLPDFGRLSAYLALMGICAIASTGWGSAITVRTVRTLAAGGDPGTIYRETLGRSARVALAYAVVALVVGLFFGARSHVAPLEVVAFTAACVGQLQAPVLRAIFQGCRLYRVFVASTWAEFAARLALAPLFALYAGVPGALAGFFAGGLLSVVVTTVAAERTLRPDRLAVAIEAPPHPARATLSLGITSALLYALSGLDIVIVQRVASGEVSGLFAALNLAGRAEYFALGVIPTILFPAAAALAAHRRDARHLLLYALGAAGLGALAISSACGAVPRFVLDVLGGSRYESAAGYLWPYTLAVGGLLVAHVAATYCFAMGRVRPVYLTAGVLAVETVLLALNGGSLRSAITVIAAGHGAAGILTAAMALTMRREPTAGAA